MAELACRFCRVLLSAEGGCAMCTEWKRHLVSADEDADARPALADVTMEAISGLRIIIRRVRPGLSDTEPRVRIAAERDHIAATHALQKIVDSARKLQGDGVAAIRAMAFEERARLFVDWYLGLAPGHRGRLRVQLNKADAELAAPRTARALTAPEVE